MAGKHRRRRAWRGVWSTGRLAVLSVLALAVVGVGGVTTRLTVAQADVETTTPAPPEDPAPDPAPDRLAAPASTTTRRRASTSTTAKRPAATPAPTTAPAVAEPSPFPAVPASSGTGRRIVYCNSCQRVWLVESDGSVARSYQVSGRRGVPRPGTYSVKSKSNPGSTENGLRLGHMVRFTKGRSLWIGFHAIPVGAKGPIQSQRQLGQALSLGCIRQAPADAVALWEFAPVDTAVVVLA